MARKRFFYVLNLLIGLVLAFFISLGKGLF